MGYIIGRFSKKDFVKNHQNPIFAYHTTPISIHKVLIITSFFAYHALYYVFVRHSSSLAICQLV